MAGSLTIEALSESSGVSVRGIGDLERGRRAMPQRRTVAALADGLGLQDAQREQLLAAARSGRSATYRPVGTQALPRGVRDFVGREPELRRFADLAGHNADRGTGTDHGTRADTSTDADTGHSADDTAHPVVAVISGTPGSGKTTLALHAGRRLAGRFPDGQLVLDLRGTQDDPPGEAELRLTVLKAFGVPDRDLAKAGREGHAALYQQVLRERRSLLILDNARDEAQVRPLLPGTGTGMVLITSRRMLTGLDSVHRIQLGELDAQESTAFLTQLIGARRADADPAALAEVAERCGRLPLALRVAGNWLATRTGWTVRRLADRLALEERRLATLSAGDVRVTAAFDLSYRQLTPAAASMFRRLSLVPGPDVSAAGAAQLTGQELFDAEDTLEELVETGLLGGDRDRYRLHDLLRLYAGTRLAAEEDAAAAEDSRARMYGWLLRTAVVAGRWYEPEHGAPPPTWQGTVDLSSADRARAWLQAEGPNWLAALRAAAAAGENATVVEVAESLHWFSDQWIFWGHWHEVFGIAVGCAQAMDDPLVEATQLNYQAWAVLLCEGRPRESLAYSASALDAAQRAEDPSQQAWAHHYTAWAYRLLEEPEQSIGHNAQAAALFQSVDDLHGYLQTMHIRALLLSAQDRELEAIDAYRSMLAWLDDHDDVIEPHSAAITRLGGHQGIGTSYSRLGDWDNAVFHMRIAARLSDDGGNTALLSRQLVQLSQALLAAGLPAEAREELVRCLALGPDADPQRMDEARELLTSLDAQ